MTFAIVALFCHENVDFPGVSLPFKRFILNFCSVLQFNCNLSGSLFREAAVSHERAQTEKRETSDFAGCVPAYIITF